MANRAQINSVTSLARYANARAPDVEIWHGNVPRDFCNSFWGAGDSGPNIMFARMRGASKTTDELRNFWAERCTIELEYAAKLAKLAKQPVGGDEIGELRTALDTLRIETEKQAQSHTELANLIRQELEEKTGAFHQKQITHRRTIQVPLERKFKEKQNRESYVKKSREKYESDVNKVNQYSSQMPYAQAGELVKLQQKLQRAQQTLLANEKDFAKFTQELHELTPSWEREWKEYCDSCQDLEEERLEFMKDLMWAYANHISTICVADDSSCERVRTALDQLEAERDVDNFVHEYGTGNAIVQQPAFVESDGLDPQLPPAPIIQYAQFQRVTRRVLDADGNPVTDLGLGVPEATIQSNGIYHSPSPSGSDHHQPPQSYAPPAHQPPPVPVAAPPPVSIPPPAPAPAPAPAPVHVQPQQSRPGPSSSGAAVAASSSGGSSAASRAPHRISQPLPILPGVHNPRGEPPRPQTPPPPVPEMNNNILFYVKALYDYTATIDEEFDFQAGDIIAVTATPDDGWWSGELLDEARRVEGRHVFPSNFVCLF